jgi:hypothetical protein
MRHRIDVESPYADALAAMPETIDGPIADARGLHRDPGQSAERRAVTLIQAPTQHSCHHTQSGVPILPGGSNQSSIS